jgi:2-iminobutanoate/2-iminopropanoate deaminase
LIIKKEISTSNAPAAPGLLSQAVLESAKYRLEISGQIGKEPTADGVVEGGIAAETKKALKNIGAILGAVDWSFENIVRVRIFLTDMNDYGRVNEIYKKWFTKILPARTVIGVKELPLGAHVEIECLAVGDAVSETQKL